MATGSVTIRLLQALCLLRKNRLDELPSLHPFIIEGFIWGKSSQLPDLFWIPFCMEGVGVREIQTFKVYSLWHRFKKENDNDKSS